MKVEFLNSDECLIRVTKHELLLINNALNEVCHALDQDEFYTRMGGEPKEIKRLLDQVGKLIDDMSRL